MRRWPAIVSLLIALPTSADALRLGVGARVLDRCTAAPTMASVGLRCIAAPRLVPHFEYRRGANGTTLTILF